MMSFELLSTAGLYAEGSGQGGEYRYRYSQNLAPDVLVSVFHKLFVFYSPQSTQSLTEVLFFSVWLK